MADALPPDPTYFQPFPDAHAAYHAFLLAHRGAQCTWQWVEGLAEAHLALHDEGHRWFTRWLWQRKAEAMTPTRQYLTALAGVPRPWPPV